MLYALEVPAHGGDTSFCSMYAAWEALPDRMRRRVDGLRVKHDGTSNSGGYRDRFTIPNFLRTPIAGQTWTIFQIHTTIGPHKRTVTVHGKTKTFGLFYSYACPPNHFRQVKVTFKAVDGNSQTVTRNVACS